MLTILLLSQSWNEFICRPLSLSLRSSDTLGYPELSKSSREEGITHMAPAGRPGFLTCLAYWYCWLKWHELLDFGPLPLWLPKSAHACELFRLTHLFWPAVSAEACSLGIGAVCSRLWQGGLWALLDSYTMVLFLPCLFLMIPLPHHWCLTNSLRGPLTFFCGTCPFLSDPLLVLYRWALNWQLWHSSPPWGSCTLKTSRSLFGYFSSI